MAQPGDGMALRASHADREHVIGMLQTTRHGGTRLPACHRPHDQVRLGAAGHGLRQRRLGRFVG